MTSRSRADERERNRSARLWRRRSLLLGADGYGGDGEVCIQDAPKACVDPTTKALRARGLIASTGEHVKFPSGGSSQIYMITPAALVALRNFLTKEIEND